ncbi:MAG: DUF3488 and transglutaminase-like domain-containing protein [Myxococcota bacterium]
MSPRTVGTALTMGAGFAGLALLPGLWPLALIGLGLAWGGPWLYRRWATLERLGEVGTLIAVGMAAAVWWMGVASSLVMGGLLVYLQVHRRTARHGPTADRVTVVIAALMLVTAAGATQSLALLPCLLAWALGLPLALLDEDAVAPPVGALVLGTLGLGLALFVLAPRANTMGSTVPAGATGFTDEVELGDLDALLDDPAVVFRASIDPVPEGRPYWRGIALDAFDGTRWAVGTPRRAVAEPPALPPLPLPEMPGRPTWTVDVQMVEAPKDVLFLPGTLLGYAGPPAASDAQGGWFATTGPPSAFVAWVDPFTDRAPADLPGEPRFDGEVQTRIADLARTVAGDAPAATQVARLTDHLRDGYPYARRGYRGENPLAEFLFERRGGHCEYFASALAVMVRAIGLPSRVVNGFVGGERNPVTGQWVVRRRDAHSWVEVQLPGEGWVVFDPTPVREPSPSEEPGWALQDAAAGFWQAALAYNGTDQQRAVAVVTAWWSSDAPFVTRGTVGAGVLLVMGLGGLVGLLGRGRPRLPQGSAPSRWRTLHARVRSALAKHLETPVPSSLPPRAASRWVAQQGDAALGEAYQAFVEVLYDAVIGGHDDAKAFATAQALAKRILKWPRR